MKKKQKNKIPTYQYTYEQLEREREAARVQGRSQAFTGLVIFSLMVLRDKWGFGSERLSRFSDQLADLFNSYEKGLVDVGDMMETLEEETGIRFQIDDRWRII